MSPRRPDEPVRLTKIYTRGGDAGQTSLGDGSRVSKLDPRVVAYGIVDELNSQVGVVLALPDLDPSIREPLARAHPCASSRSRRPRIERAITNRWISLVPS